MSNQFVVSHPNFMKNSSDRNIFVFLYSPTKWQAADFLHFLCHTLTVFNSLSFFTKIELR